MVEEGHKQAEDILRRAATPHGFVASITHKANYRRIWSRDGVITSLAVLMMNDDDLTHTVLATLRTLMQHLGPHGEVPSNVDPVQGHVSYGGTAGRVDASLWFVIGVHQYWKRTQDSGFAHEFFPLLRKIEFLLGCWEFNAKGFLYIPETGNWADEYLQHGYVLYDQLLYLQALRGMHEMYGAVEGRNNTVLYDKMGRLKDLISSNYWFDKSVNNKVDAYHPVIFEKGYEAAELRGDYWMPYFSPRGYGYRFDAFANVLVSLFHVADKKQSDATDAYIDTHVVPKTLSVLPAFSPVIDERDDDWKHLQVSFSHVFKNYPYQYHNGGLWPMINGFYVADLIVRGKTKEAKRYRDAVHAANALSKDDNRWGFHEFIDGKTFVPGGTKIQTWSASAAIMADLAIEGEPVFL